MSSPTTNTTAAPAAQDLSVVIPADLLSQFEEWRTGAATGTQNNSGGGDAVGGGGEADDGGALHRPRSRLARLRCAVSHI